MKLHEIDGSAKHVDPAVFWRDLYVHLTSDHGAMFTAAELRPHTRGVRVLLETHLAHHEEPKS